MAKSSYTDELAAWIERRGAPKRRQDAATVAFLAVRADVATAIGAGYAITTVYEHMLATGRVKCSYETFRKHVQRHVVQVPGAKGASSTQEVGQVGVGTSSPSTVQPVSRGGVGAAKQKGEPTNQQPAAQQGTSNPPKIGGFVFDAKPQPKELL